MKMTSSTIAAIRGDISEDQWIVEQSHILNDPTDFDTYGTYFEKSKKK